MLENTRGSSDSPTNSGSVGPTPTPSRRPSKTGSPRLKAHQKAGVTWLLKDGHEKALVADEVGLGKTAMVIETVSRLLPAGELPHTGRSRLARVLWLTDATLIPQTMAELSRFGPRLSAVKAARRELESVRWQRALREQYPTGFDVLVMSYDLAHSRRNFLSPAHSFSMLVLDEAGNLRGGGEQWKTVSALAKATPRVVGMTATPMENHPVELFNVLAAIDTPDLWPRGVFEGDFVRWEIKYTDPVTGRQTRKPEDWASAEHAAQVRDYLDQVMLRRTGKDARLKLPKNVTEEPVIWVAPSAEQQEAYDKAARNRNSARAFHGQQKAGLSTGESSAILDKLIELLAERGDQQAIVFSEYRDLLTEIGERLDAAAITWTVVHGDAKDEKRQEAVEEFTSGAARVLIGNVVLERGLNLQNCNLLISVGSSWNPAREAQREGRIRRAWSAHESYEHVTLMPNTQLSEAQWTILAKKRESVKSAGL